MKTAIYNGRIYVEKGKMEAALLIEDGIIKAVGTNEEILAEVGASDLRYDCQGRTVIPGLNDSHLHLQQIGQKLLQVPISGVRSVEEMVDRCRSFMTEHPERIQHGIHAIGWNQDLFRGEKRMPTRYDLDKISTGVPILLERICGHVVAANSRALELLGLTEEGREVEGGTIYVDEKGVPNGLFAENACDLPKSLFTAFEQEEGAAAFRRGIEYALAHGLTSVQSNDLGISIDDPDQLWSMLQTIYADDRPKVRYHGQICFYRLEDFVKYLEDSECAKHTVNYLHPLKERDAMLTMGPLKLFKDGSLGARTALMKEGYVGDRENRGIDSLDKKVMGDFCKVAREYGIQVVTHSIGDEATSQVLDCYQPTIKEGRNLLRNAVVHCQITDREILRRIKEEDALVMAQPIFLDYDSKIVEAVCGKELAETSYAFGSLLREGVHLSYGTDSPVEDSNPFPNIYMAVTRKRLDGTPEGGFYPEQCVDVETAIDAYTVGSAYNQFMEDVKGRLKPGYLADLVVLDRDIFTVDPMEIKGIQPVMTMVGGRIAYEKKKI
jgi:hypothetical protein